MPLNAFQNTLSFSRSNFAITFPPLLDTLTSAYTAYGFTKLRTAYAGACCRVRTTGGSESDVGFDANGVVDAAALTTAAAGGTLYIKTWYDQSGNGKNLDISTFNNSLAPRIVISGVIVRDKYNNIGMRYDGTQAGVSENSFLTHATAFPNGNNTVVAHWSGITNSSNWFGHIYSSTNHGLNSSSFGANWDLMMYKSGGNATGGFVYTGANQPEVLIASSDHTANKTYIWQNGVVSQPGADITTPFTPDQQIYIGYDRPSFRYRFNGILTELVTWNKVFTATERRIAWKTSQQRKSIPTPLYIISDGDSLTQGSGSGRSYIQQIHTLLSNSANCYVFWNGGIGGSKWSDFDTQATTATNTGVAKNTGEDLITFIEPNPYRLLLAWGGYNNFATGQTVNQTYTEMLTYLTNRKNTGLYNQIALISPHPSGIMSIRSQMQELAQLIRDELAPGGDLRALGITQLVDLWTLPQFDDLNDPDDVNNYFDTVHMTVAGQLANANLIKSTLRLS